MSQPPSVIQVTSLPLSDVQYTNDKEDVKNGYLETFGRVLLNTKYVWTSNGSNFTIVNSKTGSKIAAWTFGSIVKDYSTKIVCVEELPRCNGKFPLLIIGLECDSCRGCVCIFDVTESRVLRAIQIEDKVTSLHVINTNQDGCPLPGPLRAFDGILGIGTAGGNVLLLDLCKQIYEEILTGSGTDIRDEINSCEVKIVLPENIPSLELFKRAAIKNGEHLSVHLNATFNEHVPHFILKGPKGDNRIYVNKLEVTVSALHYCPQLGSLLVGYNFGAWQLWNLMTLQLVHTSAIYEKNIPVTHFAIQEPSDDPRSFCYIWAVYSNTVKYQTGFPIAILNSLNFGAKEWHEGYGILYQDLLSCTVRFQTNLTLFDDTSSSEISHGAYCLRLQTINKVISKGNSGHEHHDETLSICAFIWNEWKSKSSAISVTKTYMRLFDINQWYKEQMPNSSNYKEYDNYMTNICLNNLMDDVNSEKVPFLDVLVNPNSLSQFIGIQKLEEHYYPSSLAFEMCSLREKDVLFFNNQGSQRSLLAQLELGGPLSLIKPTQLYQQCVDAGLLPLFTDVHLDLSTTYEFQRDVLLSIALEQQLIGWLCRCATAWSNGSYSISGSTLHFLLNWGWRRAFVLKQQANSLSTPLFDYSGLRLDSNTHNLLSSCAKQLTSLTTLFEFIFKKFATQLVDKSVVRQQLQSLQMVSVHLEVLQWLLNVGLLPESPLSSYPHKDECNRISAPYPINSMLNYYSERRSKLQDLASERFSSSESLLFIDNLIRLECGGVNLQRQWENDGGTGAYPPPSLQALLRTYLVQGVDISMKHCLVVYVFLDLAMTLDKSRYNAITTHLIKFPAVFQLSPSIIKITQAFWQLDHGDFSTAMEQLLDSLVCVKDLKIWHHRIALRALLAQNQHKFALLYLQVRKPPVNEVDDMCVVLSLYVANYMLEEAFHFQRRNKSKEFEIQLLRHFYRECDKIGKITAVVYFPLNKTEENIFMNYLHEHKHPKLENLQTFFYVRNSRFLDAYNANEKFNLLKGNQQGLDGMSNSSAADIMVKGFINTLPEISKNLIDVYHKDKNLLKEVTRPEPFSVYIHTAKNNANYKSSLIQTIITKTKEIWTHPILDNTSESNETKFMSNSSNFEDVPFLRTPKVESFLSRPATPLIFPNIITCGNNLSKEENFEPTPPKRFKPCSQSSLRISSLSNITLGDDNYSDDSSTLVTPIIKRKTNDRGDSSQIACDLFSVKTPQSILKLHNPPEMSAKVNFATPTVIKATFREEVTPIPTAAAKTKWNVTSRRSIGHTPRPAVRFNISQDLSDSSSDEANETESKTIEEVAIIHEPKIRNSSETKENNGSFSTDSYYSPNSSVTSNVELASNAKSNENLSMEMDVDPTSSIKKGTLKRSLDSSSESVPMDNETLTSSPAKRPRSRSSYKTSTSLYTVSSEGNLISDTTSSYQTVSQSSLGTDPSSTYVSFPSFLESESNLSRESGDSTTSKFVSDQGTPTPSLIKPKLKGRRSLTRKVLENNAFMNQEKSAPPSPLPHVELASSKGSETQDDTGNTSLSYTPPKCRKTLSRASGDEFSESPLSQKSLYSLLPFPTSLLEPDLNTSNTTPSRVSTKEIKTVITTQSSKDHTEEIVTSTFKMDVTESFSQYSPDLSSNVLSFPSSLETNADENVEESEKNSDVNEEEDINIYENVSSVQQVEDYEINNDVNLNNYADVFDDDNEIITSKNKSDVAEVVVLDDEEDKSSESSHSVSSNLQGEVIELDDSTASESDSSYESYDEDVMQKTDDSNSKSTFDHYSIDDNSNKSVQFARDDDVISLDVIPEEPELKIIEDNQQDQIVEIPEIDNILVETVKTTSNSSSIKNDNNTNKSCDDETPIVGVENPSDDLIITESLEKVVTPARRSKRLSSLQQSTPDPSSLPKRATRKSLSIAGDNLTPKKSTLRTRRANSSSEGTTSTPISRRRRSTSIDLRGSEKNVVLHKNGTNIQESLVTPSEDLEVPKKSIVRKRSTRSNSETPVANTSAIEAYSATRRLTRRQASLLEKSLSATPMSGEILHPEENLESDSDESDIQERGPQIGEIDPIKLLDKSNFTGDPDPDEERIHNSPTSSIAGSPVGSVVTRRTRKQSTLSNSSVASNLSTSSRLKKSFAKKSASNSPQRKQYRSKSLDVKLTDIPAVENTPSPKRKTRQTSKEQSKSVDVTERIKIVPIRRTRSTSLTLDQHIPVRRSERRMNLTKPDLTEITEEQSAVEEKGKKTKKR